MASKFLYTITTGRSGTVYLTNLLKQNLLNATVYHERTGYQSFGVHTPDASHFTLFNSVGNVEQVQRFWQQKHERDRLTVNDWYIETSHFLAKAGLMENLEILKPHATNIHIIILRRDVYKTLWSYVNRFDFFNSGFTWLFTLDHRYPKVIVKSASFAKHGMFGIALWYIIEMRCRAEYYKQVFAKDSMVHFHDIQLENIIEKPGAISFLSELAGTKYTDCLLPEKVNQTKNVCFGDKEREFCQNLVGRFKFNASEMTTKYIKAGGRL